MNFFLFSLVKYMRERVNNMPRCNKSTKLAKFFFHTGGVALPFRLNLSQFCGLYYYRAKRKEDSDEYKKCIYRFACGWGPRKKKKIKREIVCRNE